MKKIGVALIGYGMAGKIFHLPPLINHESYAIISILTNNPKTVAELQQEYPQISVISRFEQALENQNTDLVIIATPNEQHFEYTKRALLAGKHVVVEKPFTATYREAKTLFDLAHQQDKLLRVYHNRRYDGDILAIHDVIKSGKLGKVISFMSRYDTYTPIVKDRWRDKPGVMTGVFYDLAPHLVDHALRLFGLPNSVYAKVFCDREGAIVDDHFEMTLYYRDFVCYLGAQKMDRNPLPRFQIIGTRATYVKYGFNQPDLVHVNNQGAYHKLSHGSRLIYLSDDQKDELVPVYKGKHYLFYDCLAQDIRNRPDQDIDAQMAMNVILVMEMATQSMLENKDVLIPHTI